METRRCFLLAIVLVSVVAGTVGAQPLWLDRSSRSAASLEFLKPSFNSNLVGDADLGFFTATWVASARMAATDVLTIVYEVPFTKYSEEGFDGSSTIGNIYFGAEVHSRETGVFAEFGARAPAVEDKEVAAIISGTFTDIVDRTEAYVNEAVPVLVALNHYQHRTTGLVTRVRGGITFWVPTGNRDDAEFFFLYGGQVGYSSAAASVLVGLSGRWILTEDTDGFGEATIHQLAITAGPRWGRFNPAFNLRVPLDDDLSDAIDLVWGLSVNVEFGQE